jgi:Tfp pilus assembly protein PilO
MNRRTVILGALIAVGVVALWWMFVFSPKSSDLGDAKDAVSEAQRRGQTLAAQANQLRDLEKRSPQLEAQLAKYAAAIPEQPNQSNFISGLNDIADASGITWQSVTMQEPTQTNPGEPPTIQVQISLDGGFFQTLDYLNRLEDLDRLVVVDSVTINGGEGSSGSGSGGGSSTPTGGLTTKGSGDLTTALNARIFSQSTLDSSSANGSAGDGSTNGSSGSNNGGAPNSGEVAN